MKLAVFGKTGQVATELQRRAGGHKLQIIGRDKVDFSDPDQVFRIARTLNVDAVINAVAYTGVDTAEDEPDLANTVNGASVGQLAEACATTKTPLVHISTDYVFEGGGTKPWTPQDVTAPQGAYGVSKLIGEDAVRASGATHVILRTSWVFSAHGNNFVKTMLRLGAERETISVVNDQIGGPTPAADIADACLLLAEALTNGAASGTHHFSGAPDASWADFARAIFAKTDLATKVIDIPSSEFKTKAVRPLNSRMDCTALERDFGIDRPDWQQGLADVIRELAP